MTQHNATTHALPHAIAEAARVSRLHPLDPAKRDELKRVLAQKAESDNRIQSETKPEA
jgi:hypothetical protein